jgi:hypothetical protein
MSYCRQDEVRNCNCCHENDHDSDNRCGCDRDYWFRTEHDCPSRRRNCGNTPIFPRVLQANLVIPQTVIPIRIIVSPVTGLGGVAAPLVQTVTAAQNITFGGTAPFDANLLAGNGVFTGF